MSNKLSALLLYGSAARGDQQRNSDVDLLGVVGKKIEKHATSSGLINLTIYKSAQLEVWAKSGNLFALHLVSEARALFDPHDFLGGLSRMYSYRESYRGEEVLALAVLRELDHSWLSVKNWRMRNSMTAWSLRTICAAKGAKMRRPIFSSSEISEVTSDPSLKKLIEVRRSRPYSRGDFERILNISQELGGPLSSINVDDLDDGARKYLASVASRLSKVRGAYDYNFPV